MLFGIQTLQPIAFLGTALIVRLYWNDNKAIMDKFLTQPPKKKPKTDAEKQKKAKEYEQPIVYYVYAKTDGLIVVAGSGILPLIIML